MTSVTVTIGGTNYSNYVIQADLWRESLSAIGRFELIMDPHPNNWSGLFSVDQVVTITIDGIPMMEGYIDDIRPFLADAAPSRRNPARPHVPANPRPTLWQYLFPDSCLTLFDLLDQFQPFLLGDLVPLTIIPLHLMTIFLTESIQQKEQLLEIIIRHLPLGTGILLLRTSNANVVG